MKAKPVDRRQKRTQQLLRSAMIELMQEKGYAEITVQDIIDRANVGRSTFYAHFYDKEDLLLSGFEELRDAFELEHKKLVAAGSALPLGADYCLFLFRHTRGHHGLYKALVGKRGSEEVMKKIFDYFSRMLGEHFENYRAQSNAGEIPAEVRLQVVRGALFQLLSWWLDNDMPYTPEQMTRWFSRLALEI